MQNRLKHHLIFYTLLFSLGLYLCLGLLLLGSAIEGNYYLLYKQIFHILLSLTVGMLIMRIPSTHLQQLSYLLYILGIGLLILVLTIGYTGKGAQRWLDLGFIRFEPSEIMKIALPLTLASRAEQDGVPIRGSSLILCLFLVFLPFLLIAKQPDLGTASIVAIIGMLTLLVTGFPFRYCAYGVLGLIVSSPVLWHLLHGYQKQRILTLLMPENDISGKGYHIMQAKIAIGSGKLFGQGWLQGTQSHLDFLPEHNTDFIFALGAEEFGFLGSCLLMTIFFIIMYQCVLISIRAQNIFTRIASAGITIAFSICTFINIAMVCGMIPVVGIPLPLISYGGTTMVITLLGFSIVLSCSKQEKLFAS